MRGLVELLPNSDGIWPLDDRVKWLRLAAGIFDLGYVAGDGEHKTISIAVVKAEPGNRKSQATAASRILDIRSGL